MTCSVHADFILDLLMFIVYTYEAKFMVG